ncbi:MAG: shikimate kinase [Negativicutes bacterium]|nr:shikimate kinase [Negativicutes bacterium]
MKNIILVGFMGTGKTTVGQLLAKKLNRQFIDVDRKIEAYCGMPVGDIFKLQGELFFRRQEQLIIKDLLPHRSAVVATGGGAILSSENVSNMRAHGVMICLEASVDEIIKRIGLDASRPLLNAPNKEERVAKLLAERANRYQLADFSVDTSALAPEEVAEKIIGYFDIKQYGYEHTV